MPSRGKHAVQGLFQTAFAHKKAKLGDRTEIIVADNGHLLPGTPKRMTSFSTGTTANLNSRWPVSRNAPFAGVATMGYKGIQTDYLPTSTVYLRNNPDNDEFNYK